MHTRNDRATDFLHLYTGAGLGCLVGLLGWLLSSCILEVKEEKSWDLVLVGM